MDKIRLTKKGKEILIKLHKGEINSSNASTVDFEQANLLKVENLVDFEKSLKDEIITISLTDLGRAYILSNPKLKNPSIWDDKKYWITTSIAIAALFISIIALII